MIRALAIAVVNNRSFCWIGTPSQQWKAMKRVEQYILRFSL